MVNPGIELLIALRKTISKLESGSAYQWGHMGCCNCGHLAQELTNLTKAQIHEYAMQRTGDWNDQVLEYCPDSGLPIDAIIDSMLNAGLTIDYIRQLEKLSNPGILAIIPSHDKPLSQNKRSDVIIYMNAWVKILEGNLMSEIKIHSLEDPWVQPIAKTRSKFKYSPLVSSPL
ncbi:MAG TPA: hypothetical protein VGA21_06060 [Cyclobacteriaceae bacterium]|jgi:hypothetical protein